MRGAGASWDYGKRVRCESHATGDFNGINYRRSFEYRMGDTVIMIYGFDNMEDYIYAKITSK